jgi:hypothetical protein
MTVNGPMTRADRVATLEEAKAQFQQSCPPRPEGADRFIGCEAQIFGRKEQV